MLVVPAPVTRCAIDDPRLAELSGLVADDGGLWAMADGGRQVQVHRIDPDSCAVLDTRTGDVDPVDPEDMARGPDGTLWVGDIGDNRMSRKTVAVVEIPANGRARLHRLSYPDGPHDAEALLVDSPAAADRGDQGRESASRHLPARAGAGRDRTDAAGEGGGRGAAPVGHPRRAARRARLPGGDGGCGQRRRPGGRAAQLHRRVAVRGVGRRRGDGSPADRCGCRCRTSRRGRRSPSSRPGRWCPGRRPGAGCRGRSGWSRGRPPPVPAPEAAGAGPDGTTRAGPGRARPDRRGPARGDRRRPGEPMPEWWPAAIGAGALAGVLVLIAVLMAIRAARRRR